MADNKKFLSSSEAARYLGVTISYLYKMTSKKMIPYYNPGGKKLLFKPSELDDWIEKSRVPTDKELLSKSQTCHIQ